MTIYSFNFVLFLENLPNRELYNRIANWNTIYIKKVMINLNHL